MGMDICAYDPYVTDEEFAKLGVMRLGFQEVVRECDILSLHIPHTKETHEMVNAASLELLSSEAFLINTSRGAVLREADVIELLRRKKMAGFGADVFREEPLPLESALRGFSNVVLTPHIGAYTEEAYSGSSLEAAQIVIDFFAGQLVRSPLNPPVDHSK